MHPGAGVACTSRSSCGAGGVCTGSAGFSFTACVGFFTCTYGFSFSVSSFVLGHTNNISLDT